MLMPKRVKCRKQQRGRIRGKSLRGAELIYGDYGLQALEPGWISARQIEAARRTIVRAMKRHGKCGFAFSRTNPTLNVHRRPVWVKERARWNTGWPWFVLEGSCLSWAV